MGFDFMLDEIQETIDDIPKGQMFFAKSLLKGAEWEALPKGDRLKFGKYFKSTVAEGKVTSVVYCGKAENNSALYKKI